MSAALQLTGILASAASLQAVRVGTRSEEREFEPALTPSVPVEKQPVRTLAFYRKHTEAVLRRYLYASMLVGRAPSMLDHPVARGWATSRPVRSFEEAVNFVLDVEACVAKLSALDRCLLNRVVLQEYTVSETAIILRTSVHRIVIRLGIATDRLTAILLRYGLLVIPK